MKTVDVITPILFSLLFIFVTTDWKLYYIGGLIVSILVWLSSLLIPESPIYLVS